MIIKEHIEDAKSPREIVLGFGVTHLIEGSYLVIAKFLTDNGPQKYFASGPNMEHVLHKIQEFKNLSNFNGNIYKVQNLKCVPISCNGEYNVKNW